MKIEPHTITVRELVAGYRNGEEEGVVAYGGKLDVRPKYQREFIYSDDEQKAVIDTVTKGYPLNVMYWAARMGVSGGPGCPGGGHLGEPAKGQSPSDPQANRRIRLT